MNKVILVTGGNRGIGLGICKGLAAMGHQVILASRTREKGEEAARTLEGDVTVLELAVTSDASIMRRQRPSNGI